MESNGKSMTNNFERTLNMTSPIVFGTSGTECQHSFFQAAHQGTLNVYLASFETFDLNFFTPAGTPFLLINSTLCPLSTDFQKTVSPTLIFIIFFEQILISSCMPCELICLD